MKKLSSKILVAALALVLMSADIPALHIYAQTASMDPEEWYTLPVSMEITHIHIGDETKEGGCYAELPHQHAGDTEHGGDCYGDILVQHYYDKSLVEIKTRCSGTATSWWSDDWVWHAITSCGHNCDYSGLCRGINRSADWYDPSTDLPKTGIQCEYYIVTDSYYVCNKCRERNCDGYHWEYELTCSKTSEDKEIRANCGMTEESVLGTFTITPEVQDRIVSGMGLTASMKTSVLQDVTFLWVTREETDQIDVAKNGIYSCIVSYFEDDEEHTGELAIEVKNIDCLAPVVVTNYTNGWKNGDVTVNLSAYDPRTAESINSGLPEECYSWDGGETWTSETSRTFTYNQSLEVWVKDLIGNTTKLPMEIRIDRGSPYVGLSAPGGWTAGNVTITAAAGDQVEQEEDISGGDAIVTSEASGLAPECYSWDGGSTWTNSATYTATDNGQYSVIVRDNAGNTASASIQVSNIDKIAPVINSLETQYTEWFWYLDTMQLTVFAEDKQSGLPEDCYSWDGGETWTRDNTFIATESGSVLLVIRDMVGNLTKEEILLEKQANPTPIVEIKPVDPTPKDQLEENLQEEVEEAAEPEAETKEKPTRENVDRNKDQDMEETAVTVIYSPDEEDLAFMEIPTMLVATVGTGTTTGGMIIFVVFWIFRKCRIIDAATGKKIGKAYIHKQKDQYLVKISKRILAKTGSQVIVQFSKNFAKANADKCVEIRAYGKGYLKNITEKISLKVR